jgi:putative membrane protein
MTTPKSLDFAALERPSPKLLTYYLLTGLLTGPGMVIAIPAMMIRYNTLRYRFEESGIRMQVGLFFRNEVVVAFRRIQDIHVNRNIIQRWLGIASVSIQTASGNATPEIVLEGITNEDEVRDWLYERMRGAKGQTPLSPLSSAETLSADIPPRIHNADEITSLLRGIRDNLAHLVQKQGGNTSNERNAS